MSIGMLVRLEALEREVKDLRALIEALGAPAARMPGTKPAQSASPRPAAKRG